MAEEAAASGRRPQSALVLALVLGGSLALALLVRWFWVSGDPSSDLVVMLKSAEQDGIALAIRGEAEPLTSPRPRYERLSVELSPGEPTAFITATLDLEGKLGDTVVHSLGFERVRFQRDGRSWEVPDGMAPMLSRALEALCARRRALQAGKLPALASLVRQSQEQVRADPALAEVLKLRERRYEVKGWYLRLERDSALVSEEYRLVGTSPERPVDERGARRLELRLDPQGEFYFVRGLM